MKFESDEIKKARLLLNCWYAGESTGSDEEWLMEFFRLHADLPADMVTDRDIFISLSDHREEPVKMPGVYRRRVESALEKEMRGSRMERPERKYRLRRVWYAAAVFLTLFAAGISVMLHDGNARLDGPEMLAGASSGVDTAAGAHAAVAKNVAGVADTTAGARGIAGVVRRPSGGNGEEDVEMTSKRRENKSAGGKQVYRKKKKIEKTLPDACQPYDEYAEEEAEMMARGYRVVRNNDEARAIVGLVMAKVQTNVVESGFLLDDTGYRYEEVINKPL